MRITLLLCSIIISIASYAQNQTTKKALLGNWNGIRDSLENNGISIDPRLTVFNQNFVAGTGEKKSDFNGKAQLDLKLNGKSIGLDRWTLVSKLEYNFGNNLEYSGNILVPTNTAIAFPGFHDGERFDISNFYLLYNPGSKLQILAGKINMIDMASGTKYSGGNGLDAFWNLGFAAPISGITPPYILGSIVKLNREKLKWTFMVYDPVSTVGKSGLKDPFNKGVVLSASPTWKVTIGNSEGSHSLRVAYSTQDGSNLYSLGDINPPTSGSPSTKKDRYFASYSFNQPLKTINDNASWGIFGQFGISDGNPNPLDFSILLGIGGNSFFKNRSQDKWGIAFYDYSLSNIIDDEAASLGIPLRNELGLETFYQYWINGWSSIGADVQIIKPIPKQSETAVFLGLRSSVKF